MLAAPGGPVVGGEGHVRLAGEQRDGLGQVAGPDAGFADRRAAQGQDVVQVVRGVLGHAQGAPVGEEDVHLGGRLGAGRELEDDAYAVHRLLLAGAGDVQGGRDERDGAGGAAHAEAAAELALRAAGQVLAVHVGLAAVPGGAGVDALGDGVLHEVGGREHGNGVAAGDAAGAAEVVDVGGWV
ncbi:hypothetical protein GCM10020001_110590 [Nonomuraea salmonea]